jgi:nitrate/nitrite-specific signal transduction histidine kinase
MAVRPEEGTVTRTAEEPLDEADKGASTTTHVSKTWRRTAPLNWIIFSTATLAVLLVGFYALTDIGVETWLTTIGQVVAVLIATGLGLTCWWARRRQLGTKTIRGRLLVSFVLIALLPGIAISAGAIVVGFYNGRQQALDRLESVAALKEIEINTWTHALQNELVVALNEEYALDRARVVLDLAQENKYYDYFNKAMRYRLHRFANQSQQIEELFLVDVQGQVVLSTHGANEGKIATDQRLVEAGWSGAYAQLPFRSGTEDLRAVTAVIPVMGNEDEVLGLLAGRASAENLYQILRDRSGLGTTGKTYLVDSNRAFLTDPASSLFESGLDTDAQMLHTAGIDAALEHQANGSGVYNDLRDVTVVGVYRWLPGLQSALLVEQDLSEAFSAVYATLAVNVGIALVCVVLAVAASLFITRSISTPLTDLVETASQIAAGDLHRVARVEQEDEVGVLARAFNSMTAQLRELIDSLEKRVVERTRALREANEALRQRALQLETSAQVSREITSILDIDDLLARVVELIRDAFGYYHVHIFLIGKEANDLVLRASTGEVSTHSQRLSIGGQSLNGHVAQTNEPLAVNDVRQDPRYLPDALLPKTRSELVIPLRVGQQVVGTLDVQSSRLSAFTPEDVLVIQSLGDQIAIAIENARLYDRSRELATLEERHRLARELHDSVSQSLFSLELHAKAIATYLKRDPEQAETRIGQLRQITHDTLQEMRSLIFDLHPPSLEDGGLVAALRQQLDLLRRPDGPQLALEVTGEGSLPIEMEHDLLRIAQEAVRNAIEHAEAQRIVVALTMEDGQVTLSVSDDGRGFDQASVPVDQRGFGLLGMRERSRALGVSLEILTEPGAGTQVRVCLSTTKGREEWSASAS